MATTPATSSPLFPGLVQRYGLGTALALLPLLDPNASGASKAFAGGSLGSTGVSAAGNLSGSPTLAGLGNNLGTGLGLAGLGYNAYDVATNPRLSPAQKGASIGEGVGGLGANIILGGPYGVLPALFAGVGGQLQKSGSPQLRGTGRFLSTAGHPVDVTKNPFSASGAKKFTETMVLGGPLGMALSNAIGFNPFESTPTKGTQFRSDLQSLFKQLGLPGFNRADPNVYTAGKDPASFYKKYDPKAVTEAQQLGTLLAQISPVGKKNPAFNVQAENVLLSTLGNNITNQYPALLKRLGG